MKPFVQNPLQAEPVKPVEQSQGPLPGWSELPLSRQQELLAILASLLLRHWPQPSDQPQEVSHEPQS